MASNTSEDKAADTTFLALQRPRSGILFLPTTLTERLGAADHVLVASSMAVARWNCQLTAQPVVEPATLVTLVTRSPVQNQPPVRAALVQIVPCSVQSLALPVAARLPDWVRCVNLDANPEHVVSVRLVRFWPPGSVRRWVAPSVAAHVRRILARSRSRAIWTATVLWDSTTWCRSLAFGASALAARKTWSKMEWWV